MVRDTFYLTRQWWVPVPSLGRFTDGFARWGNERATEVTISARFIEWRSASHRSMVLR